MDQKFIDLYDEFTHGTMSRRSFLDRLTKLAGGSAAAAAMIPLLHNNYAQAPIVAENDERLAVDTVEFAAECTGYLARLKGGDKRPGVVVIHENRGLNPHIKDVTRRMGAEGFLALGVDMLSPLGGTPADEDKGREMIRSLDGDATVKRLVAAVKFLEGHEESTGKVGAVGFCWGGGMVNRLAVAAGPSLQAGVPYYGRQVPLEDVPKISAALLLQYAGNDERINAGIADYEAALKANNISFTTHMYEGANHAFNNDTNAARYNEAAAKLAWGRTVAFFKKHLGG